MAENVCPQCGAPIGSGVTECRFCGEKLEVQQVAQQVQQPQAQPVYVQQPQPQVIIQQTAPQQVYMTGINPSWPIKSKVAAGILGIF